MGRRAPGFSSRQARARLVAPGAAAARPTSCRGRAGAGGQARRGRPASGRGRRPPASPVRRSHQGWARQAADLLRALLAGCAAGGAELRAHLVEEAHHQRPGRRGDGALLRLQHARGLPAGRVRRAGRLPGVPAAEGRAGQASQRRALRRGRAGRGRAVRRPEVRAAPERQRGRPPRGRHDVLRLRRPTAGADLRQSAAGQALVLHLPLPGLLFPHGVVDSGSVRRDRSWPTSTPGT